MPFDSSLFFSPKFRSALGRYTLYTAIFSFLVHLGLIALKELAPQLVQFELLAHPINAIYTPFSILLIFESYLLIFYLRKSTTYYIAKQYEIIALILIRGIFKDMTHLDLAEASASSSNNLELLRDLLAVAFVFVLIYWFYSNSGIEGYKSLDNMEEQALEPRLKRFVQSKKYYPCCCWAYLSSWPYKAWWDGLPTNLSPIRKCWSISTPFSSINSSPYSSSATCSFCCSR